MKLQFTKMHGIGNDFVVIDGIRQNVVLTAEHIRHLADRRFGVGCDQVLVVAAAESAEVDFRYRIFNADGSEVEQCGNGARCFARFVRDQGLTDQDELCVETLAGRKSMMWHRLRSHILARSWSGMAVFLNVPMWNLCRSLPRIVFACGFSSGVRARPWPVAAGPVPLWWRAVCGDGWILQWASSCQAVPSRCTGPVRGSRSC